MDRLRLSVSRHGCSHLLLVSLPCSFVLCLPCLYICPCLGQLKPGRSLSRLASTANLRIVPFIRLAPSHNKTPLTRSLKSAHRTQCERPVIAFEWARMITLIYFFIFNSSQAFTSLLLSPSQVQPRSIIACVSTQPVKWTVDKQQCSRIIQQTDEVTKGQKCLRSPSCPVNYHPSFLLQAFQFIHSSVLSGSFSPHSICKYF